MDDRQIVALYWQRNQQAIEETDRRYGRYCYAIAYRILQNREDTEESVNDTYLAAWQSIPPHRPGILSAFLGRITRNLSLKKYREKTAAKRGAGEVALSLTELSECVPAAKTVEQEVELRELADSIDRFLRTLPPSESDVFVCRYWYFDSVKEIAGRFGFTESKVKMQLLRTRRKLLVWLEQEEVSL